MGVEASSGEYVLFLNNDTLLMPGVLRNMLGPMEEDRSIGLVGAKLLYPDGRLQEAGGIVWNDPVHLAWNYGPVRHPGQMEVQLIQRSRLLFRGLSACAKRRARKIGRF